MRPGLLAESAIIEREKSVIAVFVDLGFAHSGDIHGDTTVQLSNLFKLSRTLGRVGTHIVIYTMGRSTQSLFHKRDDCVGYRFCGFI